MGDRWDAICVGAGITSLAFGAQLVQRHPGIRILVIEKHSVPGGYASAFRRPKVQAVFDCSLHKLSGTDPGGNLRRIMTDLGLPDDLEFVRPPEYFRGCFDGEELALINGRDGAAQQLAARFPAERDAIGEFFREVDAHGKNGYFMFQMAEGTYEPDFKELRFAHTSLKNRSVAEALDARFSDDRLKSILSVPCTYVGGFPEDLNYLYFLHVVYATLNMGNAYVVGGAESLSGALAERIKRGGGEIMLGTKAKAVIADENGNVVGVDTTRGWFAADQVFINASPHYALDKLFTRNPEMDKARDMLRALRPSRSTTTVYLTLDDVPAALGLEGTEFMLFGASYADAIAARRIADCDGAKEEDCERAFWRSSTMEVTNYHALNPAGGKVVCLNVLDSMSHWPERRSPGYKRKKERAAAALIERLLRIRPGLRSHVVQCEVATPRTYLRFTNNTEGAGYGAMVGTDATPFTFHRYFPVKGVHFLSSWTAGPSYEAAFGFAEMKAKQWKK